MRKYAIILPFLMGLALSGCGNAKEPAESEIQNEITSGAEIEAGTEVIQGGPYGQILISLPGGWSYETYSIDNDKLESGTYGIRFYPYGAAEGYVELIYEEHFGICGTGLREKTATIAGNSANIGTYNDHEYWDFIAFKGEYKGIVASTYSVNEWWSEYGSQVLDILNTLSFDKSIKEGGAYIYDTESDVEAVGLRFSLKNISSSGATLVLKQYDPDLSTGELLYGEDVVIELQKNGKWESVPVIAEDYVIDTAAYTIAAGDTEEREISWEWLYGELAPGEYRIRKDVRDDRGSGDYDIYTVYAHFILN